MNKQNEDTAKVLNSRFLSYYKGVPVIKLPIGLSAFSLGVIVLGRKVRSASLLMHEYGHKMQLKNMGFFKYLTKVFIPSVTANILDRMSKLPYDYYGSPWEKEADTLGSVSRTKNNTPWPDSADTSYTSLLKMFKNTPQKRGKRK